MSDRSVVRCLGGWGCALVAVAAALAPSARPLAARDLLGGSFRLEASLPWTAEPWAAGADADADAEAAAADRAGEEDRRAGDEVGLDAGIGPEGPSRREPARRWTLRTPEGRVVSLCARLAPPVDGASALRARLGAASLAGARWSVAGRALVVAEASPAELGGAPALRVLARAGALSPPGEGGPASRDAEVLECLQYVVYGPEALVLAFTFRADDAAAAIPALDELAGRLQVRGEGRREAPVPAWMGAGLLGLLGGALSASRRLRPGR